jgi:uncharacterized protein YcbK (DUF882 family)
MGAPPQPDLGRRSFLAAAGIVGPALWIPRSADAALVVAPERKVSIYHPYAGESFHGAYWVEGEYDGDALNRISRILRDHRNDLIVPIDAKLVDLMAKLQATLGTREPLQIISGYRSPETNARERKRNRSVARNSFHMSGKAVDFRVQGFETRTLKRAAVSLQGGGVGTYRRRTFVHIDVGPVRVW